MHGINKSSKLVLASEGHGDHFRVPCFRTKQKIVHKPKTESGRKHHTP